MWPPEVCQLHMWLLLYFPRTELLYSKECRCRGKGAGGRRPQEPGRVVPSCKDTSLDLNITYTLSQVKKKKDTAIAKLQIYWSGNKYKYLIKKLLWKG